MFHSDMSKRNGLEIRRHFVSASSKQKYFDFLFGNKLCCLKTDLNFRKEFFKPELYNKKKTISLPVEENTWVYSFSPCFWIWQPNSKNPYSSTSLTVVTSVASPAAKRKQRLHPTVHHCLSSTSLVYAAQKGGCWKWSSFCAPKHGGTPGMCDHGGLGGPGIGHGHSCPPHGHLWAPLPLGLPPPGLCSYQGFI